jgi:hypothetical protein
VSDKPQIPVFEHHHAPLIPFPAFLRRVVKSATFAAFLIAIALGIGVVGYHTIEDLPWIDAILNASMILGGMGPVNELHTTTGKLFASGYALFSGLVFVIVAGIVIAPILHHFFHWFHIEESKNREVKR